MRTPKDLQGHAAKYLRNHVADALADPAALNLDWPLHPPTATAAARDIKATRSSMPPAPNSTRRRSTWATSKASSSAPPLAAAASAP
ncbi:hypothetical protein ACGLFO_09165, partial [Corynebacterium hesseae]